MYKQIAANVRASWILIILTCLLLALVGFAVGTATAAYLAPHVPVSKAGQSAAVRIGGRLGLVGAGVLAIVMSLVSYYAGDRCVLAASRAKKIRKRDHPRLFNVVEEMAIAAGIPRPEVYVINDSAPNAFATGRNPKTAKVAITTGLLTKLNRDELQGVMAHEVAHIRNYDVLFATMLGVLVGAVALLCDMFYRGTWYSGGRWTRHRGRLGGGGGFLVVLAFLLALVAPLLARLLQLAVSRRREYLADASAALLTRYPLGLASALRKISADPEVLEVANRATQHLYIVNPIKPFEKRAESLFSTHPDINDRIRRLEEMGHGAAGLPSLTAPPAPRGDRAANRSPLGVGGLEQVLGPPDQGGVGLPPATALLAGKTVPPPRDPSAELPAPASSAPGLDAEACPRCRDGLREVSIAGRPVKGCDSCGGIWIGGGHLPELLRLAPRKLTATDGRFLNFVGHGWDRVSRRTCPDCPGAPPLVEKRLGKDQGIPVDVCKQCQGVWFDDGELSMTVARIGRGGKTGS